MSVNFHMGKNGLTQSFINGLEKTFKKHELVKVTILKNACRDREKIKNMADNLCKELKKIEGKEFTSRVVGFIIYIRKWRKLKQM